MSRRNGPMSVASVGLLLLVGGTSLVMYALVAQHLGPSARVGGPRIRGIASTSSGAGLRPGAGQSSPSSPINQLNGRPRGRRTGVGAGEQVGPSGHDLTVAMLFTPSPGTQAAPDSPPGADAPAPIPPDRTPVVSPPSPEIPPSGPPSADPPVVAAAAEENRCGRSRGHRIHMPQGSASANARRAKGHVLHPCKSQGHGSNDAGEDHSTDGSDHGEKQPAHAQNGTHRKDKKQHRSAPVRGSSDRPATPRTHSTPGAHSTSGSDHARKKQGHDRGSRSTRSGSQQQSIHGSRGHSDHAAKDHDRSKEHSSRHGKRATGKKSK